MAYKPLTIAEETEAADLAGKVFDRAEANETTVQTFFNQQGAAQSPWPREALRNVSCPTVIVHGRHDQNVPLSHAELLQKSVLGSKLVVIEDIAHEMPRRVWEVIVKEILNVNHPYTLMVDDPTPGPLSGAEGEAEFQERFPRSRNSLETKALRCVEKMRRFPSRVRWCIFDCGCLEMSLSQLSALNDAMMTQTRTSMQVLQLNNKVDHLLQPFQASSMQLSMAQLSQSLQILCSMHPPTCSWEPQEERQILAKLARFKALNMEVNLDSGNEVHKQHPDRSIPSSYSTEEERSDGIYENTRVDRMEILEPVLHIGRPGPHTQAIISKLSAILSNPQKPTQFHAPSCIGSFNNASNNRFGLVFRRPIGVSSVVVPYSLFELYLADGEPSL
ncbi:hypothetical protein OIDMADRAFT_48831 [Oidiodendron maius Zn]|uniref:Peptidase S33 tripeptidyl aminopeptidase-like C-terminal domain-containing protein n=1 Tax=Oidiodendron maius (strain Zn) TaxID=913774 RepID=A0A0C3I1P7_OIDMZ|nr:hypothetical protein OIDMADRAFT_48831 [Oidiodendron maius Zn]